ncbi:hypothetical protein E2P81_ATG05939 [Venturia nashicola]|nr:hypothetical protein E2P81_ATG05939 [Venturia nashicola]
MRIGLVLLGAVTIVLSVNAATIKNSTSLPTSGLTQEYMQTTGDRIFNNLLNGKIPSPKPALLMKDEEQKIMKIIDTHDQENKAYAVFSRELIHGRKPPKVSNNDTAPKDHQYGKQKWLSGVDIYIDSITRALYSHQLIPRDREMYTKFINTVENTLKPVYDVDEDIMLSSGLDLRKAVGILLDDYVEKLRLQISPYKQKQISSEALHAAANLRTRGQYIQYIVQGVLDGMSQAYELLNANVVEIVGSNEQHRKKQSSKGGYFMEHYTNAQDENDKKRSATSLPQILKLYHQQQQVSREIQKQEHNKLFKTLLGRYNDEAEHTLAPTSKSRKRRAESSDLISETTSSAVGPHQMQNRKKDRDGWEALASQFDISSGIFPSLIPTSTLISQSSTEWAKSISSTPLSSQIEEATTATVHAVVTVTALVITITNRTVTVTKPSNITVRSSSSFDVSGSTKEDFVNSTVTSTSVGTVSTSSVVPSGTVFGTALPVTSPTPQSTTLPQAEILKELSQWWDDWAKSAEKEKQEQEQKEEDRKKKKIGLAVGLPLGIPPALAAGGYGLYSAWHTAGPALSQIVSKSSAIAEAGGNLLSRGALSEGGNALAQFAGNLPGLRDLGSAIGAGSSSTELVVLRPLAGVTKYNWETMWEHAVGELELSMDDLHAGRMMEHAELVIEHFGELGYEGISHVYRDIKDLEEQAMKIGGDLLKADRLVGHPLLTQLSNFRAVWQESVMDALKIPEYFPPEAVQALTTSMSNLPRQLINHAWEAGTAEVFQDGRELLEGAIQIGADIGEVMYNFRAAVGIASTAATLTVDGIAGTLGDLNSACSSLAERDLSPLSCGAKIAKSGLSFFQRFFQSLVHLGADAVAGAATVVSKASREAWDTLNPDDLELPQVIPTNETTSSTSYSTTTFRTMTSGSNPITDATSIPTLEVISTIKAISSTDSTSTQTQTPASGSTATRTSETTLLSSPTSKNANTTSISNTTSTIGKGTQPPFIQTTNTIPTSPITTETPTPTFTLTLSDPHKTMKITLLPTVTKFIAQITATTTIPITQIPMTTIMEHIEKPYAITGPDGKLETLTLRGGYF